MSGTNILVQVVEADTNEVRTFIAWADTTHMRKVKTQVLKACALGAPMYISKTARKRRGTWYEPLAQSAKRFG